MRSRWDVAIGSALCVFSRIANANEQFERPFELAASIGYAAPLGDAELGGRLSDTTFGAVPVALDAAYRLAPRVGLAAHLQYGVGVPTLCHTASDCVSSLGSDTVAAIAARIYLPASRAIAPFADVGIGYEWLTTRLSDSGAHSTRAFSGPVLSWLGLVAPLRVAGHWSIGPVANLTLGTFTRDSLETNLGSNSGSVTARGIHAWASLSVRLAYTF
jgi:hypothetical protein